MKRITPMIGACALIAFTLATASVAAQQNPDYVYSSPDHVVAPTATFNSSVLLDSSNGADLAGFSFSLCFDPAVIFFDGAQVGPTVAAVNGGSGPDFSSFQLGTDHYTYSAVVSLFGPGDVIPVGSATELTLATFTVVGTSGSSTPLTFCAAGSPPILPVVVANGTSTSITPTLQDGSVTIAANLGTFSLDLPATATMGNTFDAIVAVDTTAPLDGVRLGLSHDPTQVLPIAVDASAALLATNGGQGPDQLLVELFPGIGPGVTVDLLVDTAGVETISVGLTDLFIVEYDATFLPQACAPAEFAFTGELGVPLELTTAGAATPAAGTGGSLSIAPVPLPTPSGGVGLDVGNVFVSPGGIAEVPVTIDTDVAVQGFSFGVEHNDPQATLLAIEPGNLLATIGCGEGPAYFEATIPAPNSFGVVVCVIDFDPTASGNVLPAGAGSEIARMVYQTSPAGAPMSIDLVSGVGNPPVAMEVTSDFQSVLPVITSGLVSSGAAFIRGECNLDGSVDIADAIRLLNELFPTSPAGPLGCLDACDTNDDGDLNIADAVNLLTALFGGGTGGGTIPGSSGCALDDTSDTLDCLDSGSCL